MNRHSLQQIANLRVREARSLLRSGHFPGAYYLLGYAVECALKACVAKQIKQHDFPDKKLVNEAYTHDLQKLVRISGLSPDFEQARHQNTALDINWAVVKDWSEASRYDISITDVQAKDLFSACTSPKNGVIPWIKSKW